MNRYYRENPPWVTLEVTNDCPLSCVMCHVREKDGLPPGHLPFATAEKFIKDLLATDFRTTGVRLFWLGEPTMHPDFARIVRLFADPVLRERSLVPRIGFDTNGLGFTEETVTVRGSLAAVAEVARTMPVHIIYSLDAATPETYAKIRRGGDFARAVANLERLLDLRVVGRAAFPRIATQFIVMEENRHELALFLDRFGRLFEQRGIRPEILLNASFADVDGLNLRPRTWQEPAGPSRQDEMNRLYVETLAGVGIMVS